MVLGGGGAACYGKIEGIKLRSDSHRMRHGRVSVEVDGRLCMFGDVDPFGRCTQNSLVLRTASHAMTAKDAWEEETSTCGISGT